MPAAGTIIHALGAKLEVIWTCLYRADKIAHPSLRGLAQATGINLQTLKSAKQKSSLTEANALKVAELAGFDVTDTRWHDSNISISQRSLPEKSYPGRDTIAAFRSLMHRTLDLGGTNAQLSTINLQHFDKRLAKFQLDASGQQFQEGEGAELLLTVNLETSEEGGVQFGFKRVRVELTLPSTERLSVQNRLGRDAPYALGTAVLTAVAGDLNPEWHLTASDGVLVGEYATSEDSLGILGRLDIGDTIVAKLFAKVKYEDLEIVSGDGDLSANQEAVILALFEQSIPSAKDRPGWLTLAVQTLEVRRGDH
ncbi:hypothetical protein ASG47_07165 [Devosia sp. Leaf420]|uniref:hypothetical protein n=1 Tax=Devosia sp. Leaf420 TaxID=1736374 RepID=UPI0007157805|nr:hypothetical protein [Devosia sp. Leaf420]KQT48146.1 hypothetical protein ASG47_07165 [Devosia sp. Leaf420]